MTTTPPIARRQRVSERVLNRCPPSMVTGPLHGARGGGDPSRRGDRRDTQNQGGNPGGLNLGERNPHGQVPAGGSSIAVRAQEIMSFASEHDLLASATAQWVVLDDQDLPALALAAGQEEAGALVGEHFIQTDAKQGLTEGAAGRACALLAP